MSERGLKFLESWIDRHIIAPTLYTVDEEIRKTLAANCIDDAEKEGISRKEMEEEVGDLVKFMADVLEDESGTAQADSGTQTPPVE